MPLPAAVPRLLIYAGDSVAQGYRLKTAAGSGMDLSEWAFAAILRPRSGRSVSFEVDMSDASEGLLVLRLSSQASRSLRGSGEFDLEGTLDGTVRTFFRGSFSVTSGVTNG